MQPDNQNPILPSTAAPATPAAPTPGGAAASLDPKILAATKAIRQTETSGAKDPYTTRGASGEFGAYQFTKDFWKGNAQKYLGDGNAPLTVENQNKVAYHWMADKYLAGYTPAQAASEWNSGNKNAYLAGKNGVNAEGVSYDVPDYVKRFSENYQKLSADLAGAGTPTVPDQRAAAVAAGQPVSVNPDKVQPSFFGGVLRDVLRLPAKVGTSLAQIGEEAVGAPLTEPFSGSYMGRVEPLGGGLEGDTARMLKEGIGGGLEAGSYLVGGEGLAGLAEQGFKGLVKRAAITGLKEGAVSGAMQGAGGALEQNQGAPQVVTGALAGAAGGGILGGGLGALTGAGGYVFNKVTGRIPQTSAAEYAAQVSKLGDQYSTILNQTAKQGLKEDRFGKDAALHLATLASEGNPLPIGASEGKLVTTPAQMVLRDKIIAPENELLKKLLTSENKAVPFEDIKAQIEGDVLPKYAGSDKEAAQKVIDKEFAAYAKSDQYGKKMIDMEGGKKGLYLQDVNDIKKDFWKNARASFNSPREEKLAADVNYQIGHSLKGVIEKETKGTPIAELNSRLGDHQNLMRVLQVRNGSPVGMGPIKSLAYRLTGAELGRKLLPGFGGEMIGYATGARLSRLLESPNIDTAAARSILKMWGIKDPEIIRTVEKMISERTAAQAATPKLPSPSFMPMGGKTAEGYAVDNAGEKSVPSLAQGSFSQPAAIPAREPAPASAQLPAPSDAIPLPGKVGITPADMQTPAEADASAGMRGRQEHEIQNESRMNAIKTVRTVSDGLSKSIDEIKSGAKDGITVNPDGTEYTGKDAVTTLASETFQKEELTPAKIEKVLQEHGLLLNEFKDHLAVGMVRLPDGKVAVDLNLVTPDHELADKVARLNKQGSWWDAEAQTSVKTGTKSGDAPFTAEDIIKALQEAKSVKPGAEYEPYTPNEKLPVIRMGSKPSPLSVKNGKLQNLPIIK